MKALRTTVGRVLKSSLFWKLMFIPVAGVILFFGWQQLQSEHGKAPSNITVVTGSNAQQVQTDITNAKIPVLFELCTPDVCKQQNPELEKVAAEYKGKVLVVEVNPIDVPSLEQSAAQIIGQTVYPSHMLVTDNGQNAVGGIKTADELKSFIDSSLSSRVVHVTASNAQQVQSAISSSGLPVLYVLCTPDLCSSQNTALESVAATYQNKVLVVVVNPLEEPTLAQNVASAIGAQVYPSYLFVNSNGAVTPSAGVMDASGLSKLIDTGLAAKPADTTTTSTGSSSSSSTSSTTNNSGTSTAKETR